MAVEVLSWWPNLGGDPEGKFLPLWVATALGFGWTSAITGRLMTHATENAPAFP